MEKKTMSKELLASYTVLNAGYQAPRLMYLAGAIGNPSIAIDSPSDSNLNIQQTSASQDPVLFSYTVPNSEGTGREVRLLLTKILTSAGSSVGAYSVIMPSSDGQFWFFRTKDIHLQITGNTFVAGNPHGVAQVGETLYIIDYDARKIWSVDVAGLEAAEDGVALTLTNPPIDLSSQLGIRAKGQALIYLKNGDNEYLFALYLRNNESGGDYQPSILVRLVKQGAAFVYDGKIGDETTGLGFNAQEIIPITGGSGGVSLLIPAIGGMQNAGSTNFENSQISIVNPFAATFNNDAAVTIITGDPGEDKAIPAGTFDIAAIAAQAKSNGIVYILTFTFGAQYTSLDWKLYKTTADKLLNVAPESTLSSLEGTTAASVLQIVDGDHTVGLGGGYGGLSFWDILYENGVSANDEGRLWFRRDGIRVSMATDYENPHWWFGMGAGRGQIGSDNINSFDLTCETLRQVATGFSGKRGFKIAAPHLKANALKAARGSVPEEEK